MICFEGRRQQKRFDSGDPKKKTTATASSLRGDGWREVFWIQGGFSFGLFFSRDRKGERPRLLA